VAEATREATREEVVEATREATREEVAEEREATALVGAAKAVGTTTNAKATGAGAAITSGKIFRGRAGCL